MHKTPVKHQIMAENGVSARDIEVKHSYKMTRTIKFNEILYEKGQQVEFSDKNIEKMFLRNNYIV